MAYVVYLVNSETGKVESFGAYDKPPVIIAQDGSHFASIPSPEFNLKEFLKAES